VVLADGLDFFILTVDIRGKRQTFVVNIYGRKTLNKGPVLNSDKMRYELAPP